MRTITSRSTSSNKHVRQGKVERDRSGQADRTGSSWWALTIAGFIVLAAGMLAAYLWGCRPHHRPDPDVSRQPGMPRLPEDLFAAPAFSPQATHGDFKEEAFRTAEDLLRSYPESPEALAVAARLQYSLGHTEKARSLWLASLESDPQFANAYAGLGTIAKDHGDFAQAVEMFQKVVTLAPEDHHTPPLLAEALMALGRTEEAVVVLDRHVHTQPVSPQAVVDLGMAYMELQEFEKARQTLEAVTKSYPDDPRPFYPLAQLYAKLGDKQRAQEFMQEFRRLSPEDHEAVAREHRTYQDRAWMRDLLVKTLWEAGQAYRRLGSDAEAEQMWHKVAFLDDNHIPSRHELLALYEEQGRIPEAITMAANLAELEADNPNHWFNLAVLQARSDRLQDAQMAIQQALQLDPGNPRYRRALQVFRQGGRE